MSRDLDLAFLADILEHPADRSARLIYADWLEENRSDDPAAQDRAAFIRAQWAAETLDPGDPAQRIAQLTAERILARRESTWTRDVSRALRGWEFRCGFIEKVHAAPGTLIDAGERLVRLVPMRALAVRQAAGGWSRLMRCRLLERVEELGMNSTFHGRPNWFAQLVACPYLKRLRRLVLDRNPLPEHAGMLLGLSPNFEALEDLTLGSDVDAGAFLREVIQTPLPERMRRMVLPDSCYDDDTLQALRDSAWPSLTSLTLRGINRREVVATQVAAIPWFTNLRELTLENFHHHAGSVARLFEETPLGEKLESLTVRNLHGSPWNPDDTVDLSRWPNLRVLRLGRARGGMVLAALGQRPDLPRLHTLDIEGANLRGHAMEPLLTALERLPIRSLSLAASNLGDVEIERLVNHPALVGVQELDLSGIPFGERGATALLNSSCLPALLRLDVRGGSYEIRQFRSRLRQRFPEVEGG